MTDDRRRGEMRWSWVLEDFLFSDVIESSRTMGHFTEHFNPTQQHNKARRAVPSSRPTLHPHACRHGRRRRRRCQASMGDIVDDINEVFSLQSSVYKAIGGGWGA
mmetsp:Transcript_28978/g.71565  ORF Transcript_28978/g.71565 Transcript_28978/m.71565 type:complete len:105 (-) Transcript_28978:218-532(-)